MHEFLKESNKDNFGEALNSFFLDVYGEQEYSELVLKYLMLKEEANIKTHNKKNNKGYVYFIKDRDLFKIGQTKNHPKKRASMLKIGSPTSELFGYIECDNRHLVEKQLHERFWGKRKRGEWFGLSGSIISKIIKQWNGKTYN